MRLREAEETERNDKLKFLARATEWIEKVPTNMGTMRKTDLGRRSVVFSLGCENKDFCEISKKIIQEIGHLIKGLD